MSDAKFGKRGKIYSRKHKYHKSPAGSNKSQVTERSQTRYKMPAIKPTIEIHAPEEKAIDWAPAMIRSVARAKRKINWSINWRNSIMEIVLLWLALMIGGLIVKILVWVR